MATSRLTLRPLVTSGRLAAQQVRPASRTLSANASRQIPPSSSNSTPSFGARSVASFSQRPAVSPQHQRCSPLQQTRRESTVAEPIPTFYTDENPGKTALYQLHLDNGGKMVPFGGYSMPVQYGDLSVGDSHKWTREKCSLFDVGHMVQYHVEGPGAEAFLESITPAGLKDLAVGQSGLSALLHPKTGGIVDDCIITRLENGPKHLFYMVTNAGCRQKDFDYLSAHLDNWQNTVNPVVQLRNLQANGEPYGLIALQGPLAVGIMQQALAESCKIDMQTWYFGQVKHLTFQLSSGESLPIVASRGGYTGEDGFELSIHPSQTVEVTNHLMDQAGPDKLRFAGLGARDSLRLEAGMCLYGHDLDDTTTPVEANLSWIVGKARRSQEGSGFNGAEKIIPQLTPVSKGGAGFQRRRIGLIVEGSPAREGAEIVDAEGNSIGNVTSGCPSPTLKKNIAMGYISTKDGLHKNDSEVFVMVRGKKRKAKVTKMPFVPSRYWKGEILQRTLSKYLFGFDERLDVARRHSIVEDQIGTIDFTSVPSSPPHADNESVVSSSKRPSSPSPSSRGSPTQPPPRRSQSKAEGSTTSRLPRIRARRTPASVKSRNRDDSSDYYTAAWGSPYQVSPSWSRSARTARSEQTQGGVYSDDLSETSPGPTFGLEHLVPSRFGQQLLQARLSPADRFNLAADTLRQQEEDVHTPRSRTRQWVQLPQRQSSGRARWSSEESARETSASDADASFVKGPGSHSFEAGKKGHKSRQSNQTLNQQTFWQTLREGKEDNMPAGLEASIWAPTPPAAEPTEKEAGLGAFESSQTPPANESDRWESAVDATPRANFDKPLPPPPVEERQAAETATEPSKLGSANAKAPNPEPGRLGIPRLRKKVSWRGKTCIVSIPQVDYDAPGSLKPLSSEAMRQRLDEFEAAGFDLGGFDLASESGETYNAAQIRPMFPDESETKETRHTERPRVSLPDFNKWKAYTNWLTEQKLAALGVSSGNDEPAPTMGNDISRQGSAQHPPLPFSPPIPSSSAGPSGRPGMVRGHSHAMSVASPMSPLNGTGNPFGHMHRHSTFTGPFTYHQTPSPLGQPQQSQSYFPTMQGHRPQQSQAGFPGLQAPSPSQQFTQDSLSRGGSPAHAAFRQHFGDSLGPGSPLNQQILAQPQYDYNRNNSQDQRQRQHGYSQSMQLPPQTSFTPKLQTPGAGAVPLIPELPEDEEEEQSDEQSCLPPQRRAQINENIAVPTPRSHRHNPSEGLEREILEAERRLFSGGAVGGAESRADSAGDRGKRSRPEQSLPGKTTSPGKENVSIQLADGNFAVKDVPRGHKKSASGLNVAAPSFTFNPAATFKPGAPAFTFGAPKANSSSHTRQVSSGTFNAAAPVFKPSNAPAEKPHEFSFSAKVPTFEPGAPAFEPENSVSSPSQEAPKPAIFSNVELPSDIVPQPKENKAVAIVKPASSPAVPDVSSDVEDADGRITQGAERQKRQRKEAADGDEVPMFAEPNPVAEKANTPAQVPTPPPVEFNHEANVEDVEAEAARAVERIAEQGAATVAAAVSDVAAEVKGALSPEKRLEHKAKASLSALAMPFEPPVKLGAVEESKIEAGKREDSVSSLEEGEIREDSDADSTDRNGPSSDEVIISTEPPQPSHATAAPLPDPSFDEIDAVMRQMNEADEPAYSPLLSPTLPAAVESDVQKWARSVGPSPVHGQPSPIRSPTKVFKSQMNGTKTAEDDWPHIHRLNKAEDVPASDWSDVLSEGDNEKLQARSNFFDSHIEGVIGRAVDQRLQPFEDTLRSLQSTFNGRQRRSSEHLLKRSSSAVESDADDEDESDQLEHRPISRGRDKKTDQIKAAVLEALREQSPRRSQSAYDIADLHSALADMKVSFARAASASLDLDDIRAVVEETLSRQSNAVVPAAMGEETDSHRRQVSELKGRLDETLAGVLEEANQRRKLEEREIEANRQRRLVEEEMQLLREAHADEGARIQALEEERRDLLYRAERAEEARYSAEEARDHAEGRAAGLAAENEAMQNTLEEYRMSSTNWRRDIDDNKMDREEMESTIADLERQVEESQESSAGMRRRLEKLHADVATAAGQIASEKSLWKTREDEYRARCNALEAQQAADAQAKSDLEAELRELRETVRETSNSRMAVAGMRTHSASLEEIVGRLQSELAEQQTLAARYERDSYDAREAARAEVNRTRMALEIDVETANHRVNVVRAEMEAELNQVRNEVERVKMEADTAKARHELSLEEEADARREALRKVNSANSHAFDDARQKHESEVQELREQHERALRKSESQTQEIKAQHDRALRHAVEDKERSEYLLNERLVLSDAKLQHYQERVQHLEERLEITKSAAQAAAQKAQAPRTAPAAPTAHSTIPEKVSPQALRESILVLQEQLQERDSRTDRLTSENSKLTTNLKHRADETIWLRELLAVRNEDLTDLVNALDKPTYDRDAVRDSAIRIRANLQMELQEKEQHTSSSSSPNTGQALSSLTQAAAPKAAQLSSVAGSVFNSWRARMESQALKNAPRSRPLASGTPSRPVSSAAAAAKPTTAAAPAVSKPAVPASAPPAAKSPSLFAGLMTPPASNLRRSPQPSARGGMGAPELQQQRAGSGSGNHVDETGDLGRVQASAEVRPRRDADKEADYEDEGPPSPTLFREQSYDRDAEDSPVIGKVDLEDEVRDETGNEEEQESGCGREMGGAGVEGGTAEGDILRQPEGEDDGDESLDDVVDGRPPAFRSLEEELGEEV